MRPNSESPLIDPTRVLMSCENLFSALTTSMQGLERQLKTLSPPAADARRLSAILQVLPAGVVVIDGGGIVTQANPAAEDLLGVPLTGQLWRDIIERAFAPRADDGHDVSLIDGRIVNISTSPLADIPGQLVLVTDVTNTRALQSQMARHERLAAMGQMTANMAHQIRTPLSAALLYASQLRNPRLDFAQRQHVADRITSSIHHLEQLVNDMLLYANGGTAGEEAFALSDFLAELAQGISQQLTDSDIEFELINEAGELRLRGNRGVLLSCMQNLANNAIQALDGTGHLTLRACPASAGGVDLMVVDDGPGIAPSHQARLFEPFFTTRARGTGLGLAVVRLIARAHQGEAWFHSQPGAGSTFAMRLPILSGANERAPLCATTAQAGAQTRHAGMR